MGGMIMAILLIGVGMLLLVAGGETLLRGAVGLATLLRLTPAVIGLTVVAAGTSVPELAVSMIAAAKGSTEIAVANVVGSNIFNILAILGLAALIRPLVLSGNAIRLEYPVMALVTLLCVVACSDGEISRLDAGLFVLIHVTFTAFMVRLVRQQMSQSELHNLQGEVEELAKTVARPARAWVSVALVVVGVALLGAGAQSTVSGAVSLARIIGLSERVIGLTIVAAGTGLPEVVTSLVSSYRGRDDVAIGNVMGSNLFNILGILGLSGLASPLPVPAGIIQSDNWWMLGITVLLFPIIFTERRITRLEGAVLLGIYGAYLAFLLAR